MEKGIHTSVINIKKKSKAKREKSFVERRD